MTDKQPTCEDRIEERLKFTMEDIHKALTEGEFLNECVCYHAWVTDDEPERCPECGSDEVDSTFNEGQLNDHYLEGVLEIAPTWTVVRVSLSTGGPADGFWIYIDHETKEIDQIQYYFQDWFDGAKRELYGNDFDAVQSMFESWMVYA